MVVLFEKHKTCAGSSVDKRPNGGLLTMKSFCPTGLQVFANGSGMPHTDSLRSSGKVWKESIVAGQALSSLSLIGG
jgi:hypothetical protein